MCRCDACRTLRTVLNATPKSARSFFVSFLTAATADFVAAFVALVPAAHAFACMITAALGTWRDSVNFSIALLACRVLVWRCGIHPQGELTVWQAHNVFRSRNETLANWQVVF